ncbi:flagellar basal body rod protein FlgG [Lysinibacillus sp. BW-2-10]|uniref:flagellar basal body rod protein FlgG n=1 Tax=Lysinibacillus sp. BW-2-10 TaxID=2590030 RepID=UPI001180F293|nr:flagellar basal body rod protein FlgG [Lysinibacillus sp. BW-2-10]TSI11403.1 flagellar hook-basal body complex protein [Lysinibacillus sp. BW-2-10]
MLRSMYSGISGLKNHQTKLDVIGNNISNVNTYGFKKSRVVFKDLVSQSISGASGATQSTGGVNPKQVGLGSQMAAIDVIHGTGSLQTTARTLDLAIDGDGFFMVGDSTKAPDATTGVIPADSGFGNLSYTRAGNFYMDANGYLVNSDGKYLVGVANKDLYDKVDAAAASKADADKATATTAIGTDNLFKNGTLTVTGDSPIKIPTNAQSMSIGQDGTVTYVDVNGKLQFAGQLLLAKFPNTGGLEKSGNNYYQPTTNSGNPTIQTATQSGIGSIQSGFLEMSNVDLSEEFTEMIVAQRGFQANSRIITTSDSILEELVNLKR